MVALQDVLTQYRQEVEEEMQEVLADHDLPLYTMMRYHLGWTDPEGLPTRAEGGKRLRPTFCLLACEAAGGHRARALPAAAAVELIHNFSLIHDDIQDGSADRHHRSTVWKLWGEAQAINAGDGMHVLANLALLRLEERGVEPTLVLRATRVLHEAALHLCEGQYLDMAFQQRLDTAVSDYRRMIAGKTGALLGASLELGAILGSTDPTLARGYRWFGQELGLAFQMKDDVLGIWGEPEVTGKPAADDLRERKKSLPVIYALEKAHGEQQAELQRLYSQPQLDPGDMGAALRILEAVGARQFAEAQAEYHYGRALVQLDSLPVPVGGKAAHQHLRSLAAFVVQRKY